MLRAITVAAILALALPTLAMAQEHDEHGRPAARPGPPPGRPAGSQAGLQDRQPVPLRTDLFLVRILAQW